MIKLKKLFLLFSHTLTSEQVDDAKKTFGVEEFVELPLQLQELWSNVPSELEDVSNYLSPLITYIQEQSLRGDVVLIQGDFGATYHMVNVVKTLGLKAVYSTTKRNVLEKKIEGKIVKTSIFEHVRFRIYA